MSDFPQPTPTAPADRALEVYHTPYSDTVAAHGTRNARLGMNGWPQDEGPALPDAGGSWSDLTGAGSMNSGANPSAGSYTPLPGEAENHTAGN